MLKYKMKEEWIHSSFFVTYILLVTTATITFIEALRTEDQRIRNIFNLETCISVVATFFYGRFVTLVEADTPDYKKINELRYLDWSITTPMMLLGLMLVLCFNVKEYVPPLPFGLVFILNYAMLGFGYLGEIKIIDMVSATLYGFTCFFLMMYIIFTSCLSQKYRFDNYFIFFFFFITWSFYGLAYSMLSITHKNITYNVLDALSKCLVGIGFWLYYAKIFRFK